MTRVMPRNEKEDRGSRKAEWKRESVSEEAREEREKRRGVKSVRK